MTLAATEKRTLRSRVRSYPELLRLVNFGKFRLRLWFGGNALEVRRDVPRGASAYKV